MSEMREIILDTTARIFTDLGAPQEIILAGDDGWKAPLWSALEEAGLTRAWLPEVYTAAASSDPFDRVTII